jgi:hypothetical protein
MLDKAKYDHANIQTTFYMNFLPGKKYGVPSQNFVKKCAKKVTKLPDLTVPLKRALTSSVIKLQ